MSEQVNFVIEQYDSEELAEANELIGGMLINANIENERLKAENAKLREENKSIGMAAYELGRKSMADENAKLRELVRMMHKQIRDDDNCIKYMREQNLTPDEYGEDCGEMAPDFEERMRELGVEGRQ